MRVPRFAFRVKISPPLPCLTFPLNMFCNMWDGSDCFRLPVKACRPQSQLGVPGSYQYGSRTLLSITNRAGQNLSCFVLQRTSVINRTICATTLLRGIPTSRKISGNFSPHFVARGTDGWRRSIQRSVICVQQSVITFSRSATQPGCSTLNATD